jgi:hypothetical protein
MVSNTITVPKNPPTIPATNLRFMSYLILKNSGLCRHWIVCADDSLVDVLVEVELDELVVVELDLTNTAELVVLVTVELDELEVDTRFPPAFINRQRSVKARPKIFRSLYFLLINVKIIPTKQRRSSNLFKLKDMAISA